MVVGARKCVREPGFEAIDIASILAERAPDLVRRLPPGTSALLRLVLHERLLNALLPGYDGYEPGEFCEAVLDRLSVTVRIENRHYLEVARRPVVCANHPSGGIEGLALISALFQTRHACLFPGNDLLGLLSPLAPVIVPVDRARPNRAHAAGFERAFAGDAPILVFPAGVTARVYAGVLREFPWAPTFVTRARRHNREVLPVWVSGRNSPHFYLIHKLRRVFGVSLNLEMTLLLDELLRRRGDRVTLRFGPPREVDHPAVDGDLRASDRRFAEQLRREVEEPQRREQW